MPSTVSAQRIEAVVTVVAMVAVVGLSAIGPSRAVSDVVSLTESVSATLVDPYFAEDYMVDNNDYARDHTVVTA